MKIQIPYNSGKINANAIMWLAKESVGIHEHEISQKTIYRHRVYLKKIKAWCKIKQKPIYTFFYNKNCITVDLEKMIDVSSETGLDALSIILLQQVKSFNVQGKPYLQSEKFIKQSLGISKCTFRRRRDLLVAKGLIKVFRHFKGNREVVELSSKDTSFVAKGSFVIERVNSISFDAIEKNASSFVYIFEVIIGENKIFKIGKSNHPKVRMQQVREAMEEKMNIDSFEILTLFKVSSEAEAYALENELHEKYAFNRLRLPTFNGSTEFFNITDAQVLNLIKNVTT